MVSSNHTNSTESIMTSIPTSFPCFLLTNITKGNTVQCRIGDVIHTKEDYIKSALRCKREIKELKDSGENMKDFEKSLIAGLLCGFHEKNELDAFEGNICELLAYGYGYKNLTAFLLGSIFEVIFKFQEGTPEEFTQKLEYEGNSQIVYSCGFCRETFEREQMSMCGGCKSQLYCSRSCQKKHWKTGHKQNCSI